jgi:hypothetical protein
MRRLFALFVKRRTPRCAVRQQRAITYLTSATLSRRHESSFGVDRHVNHEPDADQRLYLQVRPIEGCPMEMYQRR